MDKKNPPQSQQPTNNQQYPPGVVYVTRPLEPHAPVVTAETLKRHNASKLKFPQLQLSEGEFVIFGIQRHWIGLLNIWGFVILLSFLLLFGLTYYSANPQVFAD